MPNDHDDEYTIFTRWDVKPNGDVSSISVSLRSLIHWGELTSATWEMRNEDTVHQYNNVNGGKSWLTEENAPAPYVCRHVDGFLFFVADKSEAGVWLDSSRVDDVVQAAQ